MYKSVHILYNNDLLFFNLINITMCNINNILRHIRAARGSDPTSWPRCGRFPLKLATLYNIQACQPSSTARRPHDSHSHSHRTTRGAVRRKPHLRTMTKTDHTCARVLKRLCSLLTPAHWLVAPPQLAHSRVQTLPQPTTARASTYRLWDGRGGLVTPRERQ